jgi:cell surface protein SprA
MPSSIGVRLDLNRSFSKNVYRNPDGVGGFISSPANYMKYFTFDRQYNVRWNLSKNLSVEYNSRANAIIDEPEGDLDTEQKKDSVWHNLKRFGRMKNFDQSITVNYTLPLDKIPATDWLGADYRYQVNYNWKAGPINHPDSLNISGDIDDAYDFKNTIQNSRDQNFSGKIDLVRLYNKIKFLKELNTPKKPLTASQRAQQARPQQQQKADTTKTKTPAEIPGVVKGLLRMLMSVRSINGTYSITEGTILPGFNKTPKFFGMDSDWEAPGWGFVLGSQNPDIRKKAAENGWLTANSELSVPFAQIRNETINIRANVEPSTDFKIQLDIKKEITNSFQSIYRDTLPGDDVFYYDLSPSRSGSYRISTISIKTAFDGSNNDVESAVFKQFEQNLDQMKAKFDAANPGNEYARTSQDVIIPAFIAAYTGADVSKTSLSPFPKTPLPNWRVDYTGLNKLNALKEVFQSVTLSHAYQSSYSVLNFSNSLDYSNPDDINRLAIDRPFTDYNINYYGRKSSVDNEFVPVFVISQVMISEQFSPLIGVNMRTKGRLSANIQYKTKRDLALNISNAQITELNSKDFSFELGYTKNNMKLPFKSQGRTVVLKNDVTFRMNVTVANTKTIQRKIEELNIVTNGNINFQLRPNISYVVNQKLNIQLYFERTINEPMVSNSFRRATTRFGAQVRFSLAQ